MKRFLIILGVIVSSLGLQGQNNAVIGFVKLQNSGSQPLSNVEIFGFGANPTYSTSNGMFELRFSSKKPGDRVSLSITLSGYELVNESEVKNVTIQNDPQPITIVMCKQGQKMKALQEYYGIFLQSASAQYEKDVAAIKKQMNANAGDDEAQKVLIKQMEELQNKLEDAEAQAQEFALKLASIDLDLASEMESAAIEAVKEGDIQKAINAFDVNAMAQSMQDVQEDIRKLKEKEASLISGYMMLAGLHVQRLNADSAEINYLAAVKADTTRFDNTLKLAQFVSRLNKKAEAIKWYNMAARHAQNLQDSTRALTELANEVLSNRQFADAESLFLAVLEMLEDGGVNPSEEWVVLRTSYIHRRLGDIYYALRRADESEEQLLISLKTYRSLMKSKPDDEIRQGLADAQKSLGNTFSRRQQFGRTDSMYKQAFVIYVDLANKEPRKYIAKLAGIYRAIGGNYVNMNNSDSSVVYFERAIPLYEEMNEKSFHKYDPDLAYAKYGLALGYYYQKEYTKADSISEPALGMYRQLAKKKSPSFNANAALVLTLRGGILTDLGDYQKAEKEYNEALDIYTPIFNKAPDAVRPYLADCYEGLSKLYNIQSRFREAEEAARKGLAVFPEKVSINTSLTLALLYQDKFDEAKVIYVQFKDQRYARPGTPVTYADVFLEDLNALEEKGITHPDANKVRKLLSRS